MPDDAIVIGTVRDLETVNDLISAGSSFNNDVIQQLFLFLLEEQPDYQEHPPTFEPALAQSYEFSDDRLELTFHLRENAVWSDGEPITAADVRFTWQAQTDPDVAWDYAWDKESITDVEVIDDRTVVFHFSEATAGQLAEANEGVILPQHVWGKLPFSQWRTNANWFLDHLVTSGPFKLRRWERQQLIELERNPLYFQPDLPRVDRVLFRIVPDQSQLIEQLLGGSLDMIRNVEAADVPRIESTPGVRLHSLPSRQFTIVMWNIERPQFASVEVRRALALASDRQTIIDVVWQGYARIGTSPIISTVWAHNTDLDPWPYDPGRASKLLDDAGWIDSDGDGTRDKNGVPFRFELLLNPGNRAREDAVSMLKDQYERVGIAVRSRTLELNTIIRKAIEHDFDAVIASFTLDTSLELQFLFHSNSITAGANWGSYSVAEVDSLIDEVARQIDPSVTKQLLWRLQEKLYQDQPVLFLWEPDLLIGSTTRIANVVPTPLGDFQNLAEWSLQVPTREDS